MACERNRLSSNRFRRNKCVQFNCVCSGVCPCEPLPVRMCVLFVKSFVWCRPGRWPEAAPVCCWSGQQWSSRQHGKRAAMTSGTWA